MSEKGSVDQQFSMLPRCCHSTHLTERGKIPVSAGCFLSFFIPVCCSMSCKLSEIDSEDKTHQKICTRTSSARLLLSPGQGAIVPRHSYSDQSRLHGDMGRGEKERKRERGKGDRIVPWMGRIDSQRVSRRGWLQPLQRPPFSFALLVLLRGWYSLQFISFQISLATRQEQNSISTRQQRLKKTFCLCCACTTFFSCSW